MKSTTPATRYSRSVALTAAALVVAASGVGFGQGATQETSQDQKQVRRLPNYFARVVSEDQRKEIYAIQDKHSATIDKLQKQLDEATAARDKEIDAVLSPEQLARVKKYQEEAKARRGGRGRNARGGTDGNRGGGNSGGGR
ncbi:MAG: hypothetical protein MPJ50_00045 [Pirellulales bacterium]|nr:hypothetical protein [Pirellulales bacterium]